MEFWKQKFENQRPQPKLDYYRRSLTPNVVETIILRQNQLWSSLFLDTATNFNNNEFKKMSL